MMEAIQGVGGTVQPGTNHPRSTVGTVTEIYDDLRLIFARVGVPHSPATGLPIESQAVSEMVDKVLGMTPGNVAFRVVLMIVENRIIGALNYMYD